MPHGKARVITKKCALAIFQIINALFYLICLACRLPQIYEEFYHTINNADHNKDLKWWSNNHGVMYFNYVFVHFMRLLHFYR